MDQIVVHLALPLGTSLSLLLLGLVLLALQRQRMAAAATVVAVAWLWAWSIPVVADQLRLSLEGRFDNLPVEALPVADAVVVLGGGLVQVPRHWPYPDLNSAADRVWHAARLYHAGRARLVILAGGRFPNREDWLSEAEAMRVFLLDLGVPSEAIHLEEESLNTRENALLVAQQSETLGIERMLLVTSALHMPRALASFAAVGIDPVPAATDFEVLPRFGLGRWLPDAAALATSSQAMREYLGLWAYQWRGWAN